MTQEQISERQTLIHNLFIEFSSDKKDHGYFIPYGEHLPETCSSLLEIGCLKGASLYCWNKLYGADCDIHTIDLFGDPANMSVRACRDAGFVPHEGNQSNLPFLSTIHKQFEIIVDDGSHLAEDMIESFKHLFVNNTKSDGLYVIEDTLTNYDKFWWGGLVTKFEYTPIAMFKNYLENGVIENPYFNTGESEVFKNLIKRVEIWENKIIFIWKN